MNTHQCKIVQNPVYYIRAATNKLLLHDRVDLTRGDENTPMPEHNAVSMPEFTHSDTRISELLDFMHQITDLQALGALAEWDQNTAMPGGAAEVRGFQLAALQGVLHELWTNPRLGILLNELRERVQQGSFSDADRGLVREASRHYDRAAKLPRQLVEEIARVQATSFEAWRSAKEHSDFARFAPMLTRTIALQREVADRLGYTETRYDALLNEYEPGMTSSKLDRLFAPVYETSKSLLQRIKQSGSKFCFVSRRHQQLTIWQSQGKTSTDTPTVEVRDN